MEKELFGKSYPYEKITKDDETFLRFELKEADIERICEEAKKRTEGKIDIKFLEKTLSAIKQNAVNEIMLENSGDVHFDGLRKLLSDFSCKKYGFAYGSKEIQDTEKWFSAAMFFKHQLEEFLNPLQEMNKGIKIKQGKHKELADLVKNKFGVQVEALAIYPAIAFDSDANKFFNKKYQIRNCLFNIAVDMYNSNLGSLECVETEIEKYNQEVEILKQEIVKKYDEIKIEKDKHGEIKGQTDREFLLHQEIRQLERDINNLRYTHTEKITDIKDTNTKELDNKKTEFERRERGLEEKIEELQDEIKEHKDEIKSLKNENEKQEKKFTVLDKKFFWQGINNKVLGFSTATLTAVVLNAVVGDPVGQYFDKKKKTDKTAIEIKHEQPKLDALNINGKQDTVKNIEIDTLQ